MANGDAAALKGMDVVSGTADRRLGYDEINKTRDYVAAEIDARTSGLAGKAASSHNHAAGDITSGTLSTSRIPNLSATKITSGTLDADRLPGDVKADGPTYTAYTRAPTGSGWFAVYMNSDYEFMRNTSSERYKESIEPLELDLAAVLGLEPVTYHRIGQPKGTREVGLIAERCVDVPGLVSWDYPRDDAGELDLAAEPVPEAVRYETVLPVYLLAVVKAQAAELARLGAIVDELKARP